MIKSQLQQGFALLITLVVVSVVLAIGISLLDITVKQITLSSTARDSELAFHAANAGVECGQDARMDMDIVASGAPANITLDCVNQTRVTNLIDRGGNVYEYVNEFTWNAGEQDVCTQVDMFILDASVTDVNYNFTNQGLDDKSCTGGNVCTVIFSRGFNRPCSNLDSLRTVQRELTLDF